MSKKSICFSVTISLKYMAICGVTKLFRSATVYRFFTPMRFSAKSFGSVIDNEYLPFAPTLTRPKTSSFTVTCSLVPHGISMISLVLTKIISTINVSWKPYFHWFSVVVTGILFVVSSYRPGIKISVICPSFTRIAACPGITFRTDSYIILRPSLS